MSIKRHVLVVAPEAGHAHRGAQFIGLSLLPFCDPQGRFEGALALVKLLETEERDALKAMKLCVPMTVTCFTLDFQPLSCCLKRGSELALPSHCLRQAGKTVGPKGQRAEPAGKPSA